MNFVRALLFAISAGFGRFAPQPAEPAGVSREAEYQCEWDEIDDGRVDTAWICEQLQPIHLSAADRALVDASWAAFCELQDRRISSERLCLKS